MLRHHFFAVHLPGGPYYQSVLNAPSSLSKREKEKFMTIRRIPFVLCLVASLLIVNLGANAAFPGPGEIPDPPGLRDNPNIPDFGDHPAPPGPGDNPNIPDLGDHPAPPGLEDPPNPPGPGDNPNIPDLGEIPDPPGHDGNPGPFSGDSLGLLADANGDHRPGYDGLTNALTNMGLDDPGNAYDVLNYLSGLEELPPTYPPGLGHSPPGPSDFAPTGFDLQTLGYQGTTYAANPEPATLGLLLLGALAMLRRRR